MPEEKRRRILEPTERFSEILFGLIMVMTFTGALSAATSGHQEVRTMLIGAIGCNFAWGIIDAVFYLLNQVGARGRGALSLRRLSQTTDAGEAHELIADALPPVVASALRPEDLETIRRRLAALPDPWKGPPLTRDDFLGALGVFLLVFLSTFPVVIPFFLIHETVPALRASNAVAIALLLYGGYKLGKYAGLRPWLTALALAALGILLVAITIALGG